METARDRSMSDGLVIEVENLTKRFAGRSAVSQISFTVRQLIKSLANAHTVLISTHILPGAEVTSNRLMIMRGGRILASDTPDILRRYMTSNN
jgi:ABC-type multidrug transport system ATPase subunit